MFLLYLCGLDSRLTFLCLQGETRQNPNIIKQMADSLLMGAWRMYGRVHRGAARVLMSMFGDVGDKGTGGVRGVV